VKPGELVIPERILDPDLRARLLAAAQANGIDPARLSVASGRNAINPHTGQMEFADDGIEQQFCQTDDGRIVPYTDLGAGYVGVRDASQALPTGTESTAWSGLSKWASPTAPKPGGIAGGGASGPWTSPASINLRNLTDARFAPLKSITGTPSVGGSIAKALPYIGAPLILEDALENDDLTNPKTCKPIS
jgi:hypothetical protein